MRRFFVVALALSVLLLPAAAEQPDIRQERVESCAGQKTSTTLTGTIRGNEIVDYVVGIPAGRRFAVSMKIGNPSGYFDISATRADKAMHVGSNSGNSFVGSA